MTNYSTLRLQNQQADVILRQTADLYDKAQYHKGEFSKLLPFVYQNVELLVKKHNVSKSVVARALRMKNRQHIDYILKMNKGGDRS